MHCSSCVVGNNILFVMGSVKKGFGTKLLRAIETFCKDNGATTVQAGVEKENTACISLLQKNGYSKTVIEDDVINFIKTL